MSFQRHLGTLGVQPKRESVPIVIEGGEYHPVRGLCPLFPVSKVHA